MSKWISDGIYLRVFGNEASNSCGGRQQKSYKNSNRNKLRSFPVRGEKICLDIFLPSVRPSNVVALLRVVNVAQQIEMLPPMSRNMTKLLVVSTHWLEVRGTNNH